MTEVNGGDATEGPLNIPALTAVELEDWLVAQIAEQIRVYPDEIDRQAPFSSYGLTSLQAMHLATLGRELLGVPISPLVMWNFPNVTALAQFLVEELAGSGVERFEF